MIWKEQNNQLKTSLKFKDFADAWQFMSAVAQISETQNHHPTWTNTYNKVDITLSTHDAGDIITEKDRILAEKIEEIYLKYKH